MRNSILPYFRFQYNPMLSKLVGNSARDSTRLNLGYLVDSTRRWKAQQDPRFENDPRWNSVSLSIKSNDCNFQGEMGRFLLLPL